ncbi:hypothetical protein WA026_002069 [Henosepilachna vigintioctopunctata]|uniref:FERM domain-containing protein n=1 Tax=Henosepilachna vigintioctopunctata TaxID=420089 RepID=A0AAW1TZC6_9CUCU
MPRGDCCWFCKSDVSPTTPVSHGSPVRCVPARNNMDSPKKSPQSPASSDKATVKVCFPSGGFNLVKYGDSIDIKGIISIVTDRLSTAGERYYKKLYAMRLSRLSSKESYWLHQDMTMQQVYEKYIKKHPSSEWRYELRVRYFPSSLQDLCEKDNVTFYFYYDQGKNKRTYRGRRAQGSGEMPQSTRSKEKHNNLSIFFA